MEKNARSVPCGLLPTTLGKNELRMNRIVDGLDLMATLDMIHDYNFEQNIPFENMPIRPT